VRWLYLLHAIRPAGQCGQQAAMMVAVAATPHRQARMHLQILLEQFRMRA
jgi:hypothetical protein